MGAAKLRPADSLNRDILATKFEIENEEVFHLKNLYKLVHEWLVDEGFNAVDGKSDDKFEALYLDHTKADGAKEHHIWWRTIQAPRGNNYYRYFLKIDWQTLRMQSIEIMHKGQKFKTNKGDVIIRIEAWLQLDYQDKWLKSPILRIFERWFRERFYLERIKSYKHDLYLTSFRLHQTIKQYLQLKAPVDWGRSFHPEKGV
jgi:predicted DCC family thiol-disulfide oxidoreductase YuxK